MNALKRLWCRWRGHVWLSYDLRLMQVTNGSVAGNAYQVCTRCRKHRRLVLSAKEL